MIAHLARLVSDEVYIWLGQRNGYDPTKGDLESMPPHEIGTVPTSVAFQHTYTDYATGRRHVIRVHITETTSG